MVPLNAYFPHPRQQFSDLLAYRLIPIRFSGANCFTFPLAGSAPCIRAGHAGDGGGSQDVSEPPCALPPVRGCPSRLPGGFGEELGGELPSLRDAPSVGERGLPLSDVFGKQYALGYDPVPHAGAAVEPDGFGSPARSAAVSRVSRER
jgi:hypothetical protein